MPGLEPKGHLGRPETNQGETPRPQKNAMTPTESVSRGHKRSSFECTGFRDWCGEDGYVCEGIFLWWLSRQICWYATDNSIQAGLTAKGGQGLVVLSNRVAVSHFSTSRVTLVVNHIALSSNSCLKTQYRQTVGLA